MITYTRQNKLQETLSLIFPNKQYTKLATNLEIYKPKIKRGKLFLCLTGIALCLVTPMTNWVIPFIIGWMLR